MPALTPPHGIYTLMPWRFPWVTLAVIVLLVVALGVAIILYLRHRRPTVVTSTAVTPRDRVRDTRAKIVRLKPPEPFPVGVVQENYFFELGIALRELIEYRFQLPVIGATLQEVQPRLQALPLSRTTIADMSVFMQRADAIKFAAQPSTLEQARRDHQQVIVWMQRLTANTDETAGTAAATSHKVES